MANLNFVFLTSLSLLLLLPHSSSSAPPSLNTYCSALRSPSPSSSSSPSPPPRLSFSHAAFVGGSPIFNSSPSLPSLRPPSLHLYALPLNRTSQPHLLSVDGYLTFRFPPPPFLGRTTNFKRRPPSRGSTFLQIRSKGLWLQTSGELCMLGRAQRNASGDGRRNSPPSASPSADEDYEVGVNLNYPETRTISSPFVVGTVESLRDPGEHSFFSPIKIVALSPAPYNFTKDDEVRAACAIPPGDVPAGIKVWKDKRGPCPFDWNAHSLLVSWNPDCKGRDCGPFQANGLNSNDLPKTWRVQDWMCDGEGKVSGVFMFSGSRKQGRYTLENDLMVVEGVWNAKSGQLCMKACYYHGAAAANVSSTFDCDITITIQFPATSNLLFRHTVVGHVESRKQNSDPSYFKRFSLLGQRQGIYVMSFGWGRSPQMEYSYSDDTLRDANTECKEGTALGKHAGGKTANRHAKFPDGYTSSDFLFHAKLLDPQGKERWGYVSPISINNDNGQRGSSIASTPVAYSSTSHKKSPPKMNVSFDLVFDSGPEDPEVDRTFSFSRLSAEGLYDRRTGRLCLIACRTVEPLAQQTSLINNDKDCRIFVSVQYPPTNPGIPNDQQIQGKIISLRDHNDSLHFEPLTLSSAMTVYKEQALETVLRMDLEIVLSIVSLTMAAVFIGLQLLHMRRHPSSVRHISLLMLTVLILGHMIPLVLNFEAMFTNRNRQNILQWSGGWLEVNEVVVRIMTMLVFLLLLRLLQLVWSGRITPSTSEGPWYRERVVLYVCILVYLLGGVIASVVHWHEGSRHDLMGGRFLRTPSQHSWWSDMKLYAGLILDFYLLPQVIGNCAWRVKEIVLGVPFVLGMTLVRSVPHIYDALRAIKFIPQYSNGYYYANPDWDFYSNAWDVIIPCGTMVLAGLILIQQKYGGMCLIPRRWSERFPYEKVSAVAS